jgi:hypothetical protein
MLKIGDEFTASRKSVENSHATSERDYAVAARVKLEGSDTPSPQFPQAVLFAAV